MVDWRSCTYIVKTGTVGSPLHPQPLIQVHPSSNVTKDDNDDSTYVSGEVRIGHVYADDTIYANTTEFNSRLSVNPDYINKPERTAIRTSPCDEYE